MLFYLAISTFCLIISSPFFVLFVSPILILRHIVSKYVKQAERQRSISRILSPLSTGFYARNLRFRTKSMSYSVVCVTFTLSGNCPIDSFRESVHKQLILATEGTKSTKLIYPEFQQYPSNWFGFAFWKWETNFSIKEHIEEVSNVNGVGKTVEDLKMEFLRKPFLPDKSPWSILLINGMPNPNQHTYLLKFEHELSDGASLFGALLPLRSDAVPEIPNTPPKTTDPITPNHSWISRSVEKISSFFLFPLRVGKDLLEVNSWKQRVPAYIPAEFEPKLGDSVEEKCCVKLSTLIPSDLIKVVSKEMDIPFTAILLSGLTGGLHRHLFERGIKPPKYIVAIFPVPVDVNPSKKLTNSFTYAELLLPVGETDNTKRLVKCKELFEKGKKSKLPLAHLFRIKFFGSLFTSWVKYLFPWFPAPAHICISVFPGPLEKVSFNGFDVLDIDFNHYGTVAKRLPYLDVCIYGGGIRVALVGANTTFGSEENMSLQFIASSKSLTTFLDSTKFRLSISLRSVTRILLGVLSVC